MQVGLGSVAHALSPIRFAFCNLQAPPTGFFIDNDMKEIKKRTHCFLQASSELSYHMQQQSAHRAFVHYLPEESRALRLPFWEGSLLLVSPACESGKNPGNGFTQFWFRMSFSLPDRVCSLSNMNAPPHRRFKIIGRRWLSSRNKFHERRGGRWYKYILTRLTYVRRLNLEQV